MPIRDSFGGIALEIDPQHPLQEQREPLRELEPDEPLRMLVIGHFSGAAAAGPNGPIAVQRATLDKVLQRWAPRVEIPGGHGDFADTELTFSEMDDFHPDAIYRRNELFQHLADGETHPLYSEPDERDAPPATLKPTPEQIRSLTSPGNLLDAMVERTASAAPRQSDKLQSLISRIVAPYSKPGENAETERAAVERTQRATLLMNHILHHEAFQALEAAWRGVELLVRRLDEEEASIFLLDLSREQLADAHWRERVLELGPWSVISVLYPFDRAVAADVHILAQLTGLADTARASLIAECQPSVDENAQVDAVWQRLRQSAGARRVALALPRFLLRLPYGKDTSAIESFAFEEMNSRPVHTHYLWGNPSLLCALTLAAQPRSSRVRDLPLHTYRDHTGDLMTQACAELELTDRDSQSLLDEGLLPLVSVRGTDAVVFPRLQSIANPPAPLTPPNRGR